MNVRHASRDLRRCFPRLGGLLVLWLGTVLVASGCDRGPDELLVAYSGSSQAYIEPCG